jgi:hypothetical protein
MIFQLLRLPWPGSGLIPFPWPNASSCIWTGRALLPESSRLLEAMRSPGLPDCSGVALGFDRLLMWCLQQTSIQQVLAFPFDRA